MDALQSGTAFTKYVTVCADQRMCAYVFTMLVSVIFSLFFYVSICAES